MRYGYTLYEVRKTDSGNPYYELLEQTPVSPMERDIVDLVAGLRPWATERLAAEWHDLGLYYATFSALDEDGETRLGVKECYLVWDCHAELTVGEDRVGAPTGRRTRRI